MLAAGVGGAITGFGADIFIIDDPFKNQQEADSEVARERVFEWYQSVVRTRLEPDGAIILIMTRWHQKDLAGRILENEDGWKIINLPAMAEDQDQLGRTPGQALWPERYNEVALSELKNDVGSRVWQALYQGSPSDPESAIIKREWIRWYDALPPKCERFGGIDTATSQKTSADNMAFDDVCRCKEGFLWVDDVFCEKTTVTAFAKHVSNAHKVKRYSMIRIEKNNAGEAVKQRVDEVGRDDKTYPPVIAETTSTDKVVRVMEFQHLIENGTIRFRKGSKKIADLVEHLIAFDGRGSDVDDDVDALGFAIKAAQGGSKSLIHVG
jgi:predicted phage terminase large subunit-like protein